MRWPCTASATLVAATLAFRVKASGAQDCSASASFADGPYGTDGDTQVTINLDGNKWADCGSYPAYYGNFGIACDLIDTAVAGKYDLVADWTFNGGGSASKQIDTQAYIRASSQQCADSIVYNPDNTDYSYSSTDTSDFSTSVSWTNCDQDYYLGPTLTVSDSSGSQASCDTISTSVSGTEGTGTIAGRATFTCDIAVNKLGSGFELSGTVYGGNNDGTVATQSFGATVEERTTAAETCSATLSSVDDSAISTGDTAFTTKVRFSGDTSSCGSVTLGTTVLLLSGQSYASCSSTDLKNLVSGAIAINCNLDSPAQTGTTDVEYDFEFTSSSDSGTADASATAFIKVSNKAQPCADSVDIKSTTLRQTDVDQSGGSFDLDYSWNTAACSGYNVGFFLTDEASSTIIADCYVTSSAATCTLRDKGAQIASQDYLAQIVVTPGNAVKDSRPTLTVVYPNAESCSSSISFPELNDGSIDITQTGSFTTPMTYDTTGLCGYSYYVALRLSNSAQSYGCSVIDLGDRYGSTPVVCDREGSTMSRTVQWTLSDAPNNGYRRRDTKTQISVLPVNFYVEHSNAPSYTGGMKRRDRQFRLGGSTVVSNVEECAVIGRLACTVPGMPGQWECIDGNSKIDACGGCPDETGVDCTELPNIAGVLCDRGRCVVTSCEDDFVVSSNSSVCLAA